MRSKFEINKILSIFGSVCSPPLSLSISLTTTTVTGSLNLKSALFPAISQTSIDLWPGYLLFFVVLPQLMIFCCLCASTPLLFWVMDRPASIYTIFVGSQLYRWGVLFLPPHLAICGWVFDDLINVIWFFIIIYWALPDGQPLFDGDLQFLYPIFFCWAGSFQRAAISFLWWICSKSNLFASCFLCAVRFVWISRRVHPPVFSIPDSNYWVQAAWPSIYLLSSFC